MTYDEYKQFLTVQGMMCVYVRIKERVETDCHMFNPNNGLNIKIHYNRENKCVTAEASVIIPGLMEPLFTDSFTQPWSNEDFIDQCSRMTRLRNIVDKQLKTEGKNEK